MQNDLTIDDICDELRALIAERDSLLPGSPRHWRAACEVRVLQDRLVAISDAAPIDAKVRRFGSCQPTVGELAGDDTGDGV